MRISTFNNNNKKNKAFQEKINLPCKHIINGTKSSHYLPYIYSNQTKNEIPHASYALTFFCDASIYKCKFSLELSPSGSNNVNWQYCVIKIIILSKKMHRHSCHIFIQPVLQTQSILERDVKHAMKNYEYPRKTAKNSNLRRRGGPSPSPAGAMILHPPLTISILPMAQNQLSSTALHKNTKLTKTPSMQHSSLDQRAFFFLSECAPHVLLEDLAVENIPPKSWHNSSTARKSLKFHFICIVIPVYSEYTPIQSPT